jgi:Mn-dependent DtxR family transcriptional regulator
MRYLNRILKRYTTAALVRQGLRKEKKVTRRAIIECQDFLAEALGESWHRASREAAAGLVLLRLAREAVLDDYLTDRGWDSVLTCVGDHSQIVRFVSARAMSDIHAWQSNRLEALLAKAA